MLRILGGSHAVMVAVGIQRRAVGGAQPIPVPEEIAGRASGINVPGELRPIVNRKNAREVLPEEMAHRLKENLKIHGLKIVQKRLESVGEARARLCARSRDRAEIS